LIYEKHLRSASALEEELERLDGDAGVRVFGTYRRVKCFAFATRFGPTYTVLVYSAGGAGNRTPGKRLTSKEFSYAGDAASFLVGIAGPRLSAFAY